MVKKGIAALFLCLVSLCCLLSCGLEDFYYIDYIAAGDYDGTRTILRLPAGSPDNGYDTLFDNFIIFYKIYISNENAYRGQRVETTEQFTKINSTLERDFSYLYPYTDPASTSVNLSSLENTFYVTRTFFKLTLDGANIDSVLGTGSLNRELTIAFPPNQSSTPTLRLRTWTEVQNDAPGTSYPLQRASERGQGQTGGDLTLKPDRNFFNDPELYDSANATSAINADVASGSGTFTYISLYIAAKGKTGEMPPQPVYSQPTFVGIFMLADK